MQFKVDPGAAARFFVMVSGSFSPEEKALKMQLLIQMFASEALLTGLERAKEIYRETNPGGCRMPSQGADCMCFLCRIDDLRAELTKP